jgi:hypothetical protein
MEAADQVGAAEVHAWMCGVPDAMDWPLELVLLAEERTRSRLEEGRSVLVKSVLSSGSASAEGAVHVGSTDQLRRLTVGCADLDEEGRVRRVLGK